MFIPVARQISVSLTPPLPIWVHICRGPRIQILSQASVKQVMLVEPIYWAKFSDRPAAPCVHVLIHPHCASRARGAPSIVSGIGGETAVASDQRSGKH